MTEKPNKSSGGFPVCGVPVERYGDTKPTVTYEGGEGQSITVRRQETTYTIKGIPLAHCSPSDLREELEAGEEMRANGWNGSYAKLEAIRKELASR